MELFDLIDENDVVIGITNKQEAHAQHLPHRVAAVFVFNHSGELYMQVHKKSGGKLDHSVGGHVLRGESYANAAKREAAEELGINQPLIKVVKFYSDSGSYAHMIQLYECIADPAWKFVPNNEVETIVPMTIAEIRSQIATNPEKFSTNFICALNEYRTTKNTANT